MPLLTTSDLPIMSPLAKVKPTGEQTRRARETVGLAAVTRWHHLHVRGMEAAAVFAEAYDTVPIIPMAIGAVLTVPDGILVRLRRDEFVLLAADLKAAWERLESKPANSLVTLTDITHGRAVIGLCGPRAAHVLPQLCGLDFARFPDFYAAQTSLAKVRTLIIRMDADSLPTYYLVFDRSLAGYAWEVVYDAAREWDGVVLSSLEAMKE